MSPIVIQLKGEGMPANWEKWDEALCQFSAAFIQLLEVYGDLYEVNQLYITADGMNIYFDYSGKLSQVGAFSGTNAGNIAKQIALCGICVCRKRRNEHSIAVKIIQFIRKIDLGKGKA